jgi:hypothetical protein
MAAPKSDKHRPRSGRMLVACLGAVAAGSLAADTLVAHHTTFGIAGAFGFYAVFGALSCVVFAVLAHGLRAILSRPDHYYDR